MSSTGGKGGTGGTLTGGWSGVYLYPAGAAPPVAFTAEIAEDGMLSGMTREPNSFLAGGPAELIADIGGRRSGASVVFVKVYRGFDHAPVRYVGVISPDLGRIEGQWQISGPGGWRGFFAMTRPRAAAIRLARRTGARAGS